ncbi:MAG: hypothetical protein ACE5JR_08945 [Gemmatimonadota bacterium]
MKLREFALKAVVVFVLIALAGWQVASQFNANPMLQFDPPLRVGEQLPDATLVAVDDPGRRSSFLDLSQSGCTVFYLFDPDCEACQRGAEPWRYRETLSDGKAVLVYWVSVVGEPHSVKAFTELFAIRFPAYYVEGGRSMSEIRVAAVPSVWGASIP